MSNPSELRLVLRWLAILRGPKAIAIWPLPPGSTAPIDPVTAILADATVVIMASVLLRHGPCRLTETRDRLAAWLEQGEFESVAQAPDSMSHQACPTRRRTGHMQTLTSHVPASWQPGASPLFRTNGAPTGAECP